MKNKLLCHKCGSSRWSIRTDHKHTCTYYERVGSLIHRGTEQTCLPDKYIFSCRLCGYKKEYPSEHRKLPKHMLAKLDKLRALDPYRIILEEEE
jgi:uncharacterized UBP type Zn finger protein